MYNYNIMRTPGVIKKVKARTARLYYYFVIKPGLRFSYLFLPQFHHLSTYQTPQRYSDEKVLIHF